MTEMPAREWTDENDGKTLCVESTSTDDGSVLLLTGSWVGDEITMQLTAEEYKEVIIDGVQRLALMRGNRMRNHGEVLEALRSFQIRQMAR